MEPARGFSGGTDELTDFLGTFIPLARDEAEREARHDPRPSIASLYAGRDAYLARVRQATNDLAIDGFLLPEDLDAVAARAAALWDWVTRPPE